MTERHVRTWRGVLVLLPCLWLAPALSANSLGLAQLAQQLDQASSGFAAELGSARGYASVRFAAERLGREAAELLDAIRRDRSRSHIRGIPPPEPGRWTLPEYREFPESGPGFPGSGHDRH